LFYRVACESDRIQGRVKRLGYESIRVFAARVVVLCICAATFDSNLQARENDPSKDEKPQDHSRTDPPDRPISSIPSATVSRLTPEERWRIYHESTFAPGSLVGPVVGAAMTEWVTGQPPEWGQGLKGYGRRLASGYARKAISNSIAFSVAFADGEDPRAMRSGRSGIWPRAQFAIVQTFVSRTESGARVPAFSRFAGTYGAAFISNAWYPDRRANTGQALYRGSTALGWSVASQVFYEFLPDLKKLLHMR
jgi:hypothetical protein